MKKYEKLQHLLLALAAGILSGFLLYLLVSLAGDRLIAWADGYFNVVTDRFTGTDGRYFEVVELQWPWVFSLLCLEFGLLTCLWTLIAYGVRGRGERAARQQTIRKIAALMDRPPEAGDSYPEIRQRLRTIQDAFDHKEQLLQSEASKKDDLVAYLAHDLKTPLTSVIGYLELLEEAPDMPRDQRARYTHIALEKANRLESLISDFFEITRYNIHEILLQRERIDLPYMLVQMKEEFYPVLKEKGNCLEVRVPEGLTVTADREKLGRVLGNILRNAAAYSYPDTPITLTVRAEGDHVILETANRGPTIPEQKLSHIFEKFYRLDDARSSHSGGAGLGLAIAREIVLAHGGTIRADSRQEVTTFTVTLPGS